MKIVADESVDRRIIDRVRLAGHDVVSIADAAPGVADEWVLQHADANELAAAFTVIAPDSVRIRRPPHAGA
jgi:hypothetical protein